MRQDLGAAAFGEHDEHELVAAHSIAAVGAVARTAAHRGSRRTQRLVAGGVPKAIVHALQVIDVHIEQRQGMIEPPRAQHGAREFALERSPVAEPGQGIGERERLEIGQVTRRGRALAAQQHDEPHAERDRHAGGNAGRPHLAGRAGQCSALIPVREPWQCRQRQHREQQRQQAEWWRRRSGLDAAHGAPERAPEPVTPRPGTGARDERPTRQGRRERMTHHAWLGHAAQRVRPTPGSAIAR